MHQLLAEPCPECFEQPAAAVSDDQDPLGERQPSTLQVPEQRLADLVILRGALPEPHGHLLPAPVHAERHEERLAAPVDRVEEHRERGAVGQRSLLEFLQLRGRQRHARA